MNERMTALTTKRAKPLLSEIRGFILSAREQVAQTVNAGLTMLHWHIGARIRRDVLNEKRAEYGEKIVSALGTQLEAEFGRGFGKRNLFRMIRFAEVSQTKICLIGRTHTSRSITES